MEISEAMIEAMRTEPPLNQKDIEAFAKLPPTPDLEKYANDEKAFAKLVNDAGTSVERFQYCSAKLSLGLLMLMMPTLMTREKAMEGGQVPEFMIPSDDELKLIEKNMDVITTFMPIQQQNQ